MAIHLQLIVISVINGPFRIRIHDPYAIVNQIITRPISKIHHYSGNSGGSISIFHLKFLKMHPPLRAHAKDLGGTVVMVASS